MTVRAYSHWFDDPERLFWMVDNGPGTTGVPVNGIESCGQGVFVVNEKTMLMESRELDQPKAWIEFPNASYSIGETGGLTFAYIRGYTLGNEAGGSDA